MTAHTITSYRLDPDGCTWTCACGETGTGLWDDQARRDGREHERGGEGRG